ncbi:MAG: pseudouridine synthase [Chloroherpetonaceae bacterium]
MHCQTRNEPRRKSLNRLLSQRGYCSRRQAERLVREGKVRVNAQTIRNPFQAVPIDAHIEIAGEPTPNEKQLYYAAMNKRRGTLTTSNDEHARATVYDDLNIFLTQAGITERLFAVGRLDKDTDGLLLFTNDNAFADFLTNPDNHIPKTYRARLARPASDSELETIRNGITIEVRGKHYLAQPSSLVRLSPRLVELVLTEGKNREVRRLFDAIGNKVERLTRIRFGNLSLSELNLEVGETRFVRKEEIWKHQHS